jgi:hypothetical protein
VAPGWAKVVIALTGILTTTLGTVLTVGLYAPESQGFKLILVAIGFLGAVATAVTFIVGETKEKAKSEGAARIAEAKVKAQSDLAIAAVTGSTPAVARLGDETTTTTTTATGPVQP